MRRKNCRLCKDEDGKEGVIVASFNINFKPVPVCETCADVITLQNTQFNLDRKWRTFREIKKSEEAKA